MTSGVVPIASDVSAPPPPPVAPEVELKRPEEPSGPVLTAKAVPGGIELTVPAITAPGPPAVLAEGFPEVSPLPPAPPAAPARVTDTVVTPEGTAHVPETVKVTLQVEPPVVGLHGGLGAVTAPAATAGMASPNAANPATQATAAAPAT
jgi:hypothetical protein